MNNITITGHIGADPTIKRSKSGLVWTQIRVGSNERWKDAEGQWIDGPTMWFTLKFWGQQAANIVDSLHKGTPVLVTGKLSQEPYLVTKASEDGQHICEHRIGLIISNPTIAIDLANGNAKYQKTDNDATSRIGSDYNQMPDIVFCDGCNERHSEYCEEQQIPESITDAGEIAIQ